MTKRLLFKLLFLIFCLSLPFIDETEAVFTGQTRGGGSRFTTSDWTPPESEVDFQPIYQNTSSFDVTYSASDDYSDIAEVRLYYRYGLFGEWTWFANNAHSGSGSVMDSFIFTSPNGDGDYYFATVAIDESGNIEDWDEIWDDINGNGLFDNDEAPDALTPDTSTTVDTAPPVTMLSMSEPRRASGDLVVNGGFETGDLAGWNSGGDGVAEVITDDPHSDTYSALIGFPETGDLPPSDKLGVSYIEQLINWISGIPTVSLWYHLQTNDTASESFFSAWLKDPFGLIEPVEMIHDGWDDVLLYLDQTNLGWKEVTYQVGEFTSNGQMKLYCEVVDKSEGLYSTWAFLDDIKVTTGDNLIAGTTELSLSFSDASGSGTISTEYNLDGNGWTGYIDSVQVDAEGDHVLKYRSVDDAGNLEDIKEINLKATNKVVINEVYYDVDGSHGLEDTNEWVEIYNASSGDVNLDGWRITDNSGTERALASSELVLPSGGFAVITKDASTWSYWDIPVEAIKIVLGQKIGDGLANGNDRVILKSNDGVEIDAVSWGGDNFAFSPDVIGVAEGHSIGRKPKGIDIDTAEDWEDLASPNPGTNPHSLEKDEEQANEPMIGFYLQPNKAAVGFKISGIEQYQKLSYEISYQAGDKQEGIMGTINLSGENEIAREGFTLGTCSSGGTCVYHQGIKEIKLELKLIDNEDKEMIIEKKIDE